MLEVAEIWLRLSGTAELEAGGKAGTEVLCAASCL